MTAQQAEGKRVVAGNFTRVNNTQVGSLVRLDAAGTLDADFAQMVGVARNTYQVKALPNGQYLVSGYSTEGITAGGLTRPTLLRLNAGGTADATFSAGSGPVNVTSAAQLNTFVGQPDGKVLVGGYFATVNGAPRTNLARLAPTGPPQCHLRTDNPVYRPGSGHGSTARRPHAGEQRLWQLRWRYRC